MVADVRRLREVQAGAGKGGEQCLEMLPCPLEPAGAATAPVWESFPEVNRVLSGRLLGLLVERMVGAAMVGTGVSAVSIAARLPWERVEGKVQPWHRDRLAAVYVRQSTAAQVQDHGESTRLQGGRAVALGWAPSRVLVIDEDLGHSASGADARPGFSRLVSEVGLDHLGIVLGIEMSRLARSGREWHQLLELCALSGTLLIDPDGVYDPAEHNDRLLLGLKGTISEMLCRYRHRASPMVPLKPSRTRSFTSAGS